MPTEIEHKYLVKKDLWSNVIPEKSFEIKQLYLSTNPDKTIRVRTSENKAFITIKGKKVNSAGAEFEFEIPFDQVSELIKNFSTDKIDIIEKTRHIIIYEGKKWEVDEFKGLNKGLIVAEIELKTQDENYSLPNWVGENVTEDFKYTNSNLAINPFGKW